MKVAVYLGAAAGNQPSFTENAYKLGSLLARSGHTVVYGGSNVGCMKALANGAQENAGKVIGVFPKGFKGSLNAQKQGLKVKREGLDQMIYVADFSERKQKIEEIAECFVIMPGAFGSLDELFSCACGKALNRIKGPIYILNYNGYYNPIKQMVENMFNAGLIVEDLTHILTFLPDVESIVNAINKG